MWKALPLTQQDVDEFKKLGYSDEYIRWMHRAHNPNTRLLLASENITNAAKLGKRIRWHFESNTLYRALFPETLPDTSCIWTNFSLHVKRPASGTGGGHGEGTFDFIGVGSALQSRHYTGGIVQDDLVGRKAIESPSIMDNTIDYHKLLIGAFEDEDKDHEGNELIAGNRWGYHDLNSHISENEPWFNFTRHGALGGCCQAHPQDQAIFSEEFSFEKLMRIKARLGNYHFSCQFLNNPSSPEDADFKLAWLGDFEINTIPNGERYIVHAVKDGFVKPDVKLTSLTVAMTVDPNHSGNAAAGRCRHAIIIVGVDGSGNHYLLDTWAHAAGYDTFYAKIYELAKKWKIRKVGLETIAAQRYIKHHIEYLNCFSDWPIKIDELKGEVEAPDGTLSRKKEWRIRSIIGPIAEDGRLWVQQKRHVDFVGEYTTFPKGRFVDQLDAFAYIPQLVKQPLTTERHMALLARNRQQMRLVNAPYSLVN